MAALGGISNVTGLFGTSSLNSVNSSVEAKQANADNKTSSTARPGALNQDQTSVSSAASLVAHVLNTSDARLDRVAALQNQIASGTYQVPASAVASKIVDELLK